MSRGRIKDFPIIDSIFCCFYLWPAYNLFFDFGFSKNGCEYEMSLDVMLIGRWKRKVYDANITHNLNKMAMAAEIYQHLWRPDELGIVRAKELIAPLEKGLDLLKSKPEYFRAFDAPNGWGTYVHFVPFVENYLNACRTNPTARVEVCR